MAERLVYVEYISTDLEHKKSDRNENVILQGQKTEIFNLGFKGIENHRSWDPPHRSFWLLKAVKLTE